MAVLLLALGLSACGEGDDSEPATTAASQSGSSDGGSGEAPGGFEPRSHEDSGGGSEQFRIEGGDNSVQEFGDEVGGEEFEAAAAALHNFLDARADGHWAAACSYLTSEIAASLEKLAAKAKGIECAAVLSKLTNPAAEGALREEAEQADVGSLRVQGDRSFLIYRSGDAILAIPMEQEGGEWKVASLAGVPLN